MLMSLEKLLPNSSLIEKVQYCYNMGYDISFKEVRVDLQQKFNFKSPILQGVNCLAEHITARKEAFAVAPDAYCFSCYPSDNLYKEIKHDPEKPSCTQGSGVTDYNPWFHALAVHPDTVYVDSFYPYKAYTYIPDLCGEMTLVYL